MCIRDRSEGYLITGADGHTVKTNENLAIPVKGKITVRIGSRADGDGTAKYGTYVNQADLIPAREYSCLLYTSIYRLKKQLVLAGMPEEEYVVLESGMCRWSSSFPVETDAVRFTECISMAKESAGAGRIGFLRTAERLYTGELLPEFSTELWVIERNLQLKGMYQQAVVELGEYLRQAGEYQEDVYKRQV